LKIKRLLGALFFFAVAAGVGADPLPFNITVYGLYGAPTQPDSLVRSNFDGLGFGGLAEWNPSYFASLGLSYEQATFYGAPSFSAGTLNLEGKYYLSAFIQNDAPYLSAGAGLNVFKPKIGWQGNLGLKVGLGEKVSFIGPTLLDIGFDYHWMADAGSFQYGALHAGVGYAFDIKGGEPDEKSARTSKPTATPQATQGSVTPTATVTVTPTATGSVTPVVSATITPTETITPTPEPTLTTAQAKAVISKMKKYYHQGVVALKKHYYKTAAANFDVCVGIHESVVPPYYYAEAYASLGVIYQFHHPTPGHLDQARAYYKMALAIDPQTATAKKYLAKLTPAKAKKAKARARVRHAVLIATPSVTAVATEAPVAVVTPVATAASMDSNFGSSTSSSTPVSKN
jgi:hypothetical protein